MTAPAFAEERAWWHVVSSTWPAHLEEGGAAKVVVQATNLGDAAIDGAEAPVTITDKLPPYLKATSVEGISGSNNGFSFRGEVECSLPTSNEVACTWAGPGPEPLQPYEQIELIISVEVEPGAASGTDNEVTVVGGQSYHCREVNEDGRFTTGLCDVNGESATDVGDFEGELGESVPAASSKHRIAVGTGPTPFGIESYALTPENEGGSLDTQAGSHPFQLTTFVSLNQSPFPSKPPALARNLSFRLPAGLIGNATTIPQCTETEFAASVVRDADLCPADSAVGVAAVTIEHVVALPASNKPTTYAVPVFNLVPGPHEPARFGFETATVPVTIDTVVRNGEDYGVTTSTKEITQAAGFISSLVTLWGVPGDPRHDSARGWSCVSGGYFKPFGPACSRAAPSQAPPFLRLPTSCVGALETSVQADSWSDAVLSEPFPATEPETLGGCSRLPFEPEITASPETQSASSSTGLTVKVRVPQEASLSPEGDSPSDVKDTTVTLPEGFVLNPSQAGGLEACTEDEIGYEPLPGESIPPSKLRFTPGLPEPFCPIAAKIGTARIVTPILKHPLEGTVYLASQEANPFGSLVAMYVVAEEQESGVIIKLAGEVSLNEDTGQITTKFTNTPQDPFEELELHIAGGERGSLVTPSRCGTYTTSASFVPWSSSTPVISQSNMQIAFGPGDGTCPNVLPFSPSFTGGTTDNQGGGYSPFVTTVSREDGNQALQTISVHTPPGVAGLISSVKPCAEPQAEEGLCGSESLIGEATASVGVGRAPYTVTGGKVYITGPYEGAPYGLTVDEPAKAGPFDLASGTPCDCVVVRARIEVDPRSGQLTITSDSAAAAHPIPSILKGIPVQLRHVIVTINRQGFTFNPTNCSKLALAATLTSTEGASSTSSVPFEVANCASLAFKPKLTVSTAGHASKANGASLNVKIAYPKGSMGTQANIRSAKVDLPKALPSRLTTLQRACTAAEFASNPASCPPESVVGHAVVHTQVLPVPLEGPAYFVSHGGEAFPNLIIVLQGDGVTVELVGDTDIKKGITSSTFASTPDVPFETFELVLPQGKYSALAANGNLCQQNLVMPTAFVGQNGATLNQNTYIEVEGCSNTLSVVSKKVKGETVTLKVAVPAGGKLTASGNGLSTGSKSPSARETVTVTLHQKKSGKLKTRIKLSFKPSKGKKLSKSLAVSLNK